MTQITEMTEYWNNVDAETIWLILLLGLVIVDVDAYESDEMRHKYAIMRKQEGKNPDLPKMTEITNESLRKKMEARSNVGLNKEAFLRNSSFLTVTGF